MHEDESTTDFDRRFGSVSREQLFTMLEATRESLNRLSCLLDACEEGSTQGTYFEARDAVLAEATVARAHLASLVWITDWLNSSVEPSLDVEIDLRRLGERFGRQQRRMLTLGITPPRY